MHNTNNSANLRILSVISQNVFNIPHQQNAEFKRLKLKFSRVDSLLVMTTQSQLQDSSQKKQKYLHLQIFRFSELK